MDTQQIDTDILIVGGGLSGLVAAWQLHQAGQNFILLEGRARFGGRAFTAGQEQGFDCDLGPSWFWQGQPLVLNLLHHFAIPFFEQYSEGEVLFQHDNGQVQRIPGPSPMVASRRIVGGIGRLVDSMVEQIPQDRGYLSHQLIRLICEQDSVWAEAASLKGKLRIRAKHVALAIPPRLAADLSWSPSLPADTMDQLAQTPTWMAGHAKFFAVYERPFWREDGLCGSAMSRQGPLAEIHDASPHSESAFSLMGFVGLDAVMRAELGREQLSQRALQQLVTLFGKEAGRPVQTYLHDWSQEVLTASAVDRQPQTRHPNYGLSPEWGDTWSNRIRLISSETSFANGGLVEGAIEAGVRFAQRFIPPPVTLADDTANAHSASMDWDWLR